MLLSASTPHHLPLSRLLLQPPGRCRRPLSALTARSMPFDPAAAYKGSMGSAAGAHHHLARQTPDRPRARALLIYFHARPEGPSLTADPEKSIQHILTSAHTGTGTCTCRYMHALSTKAILYAVQDYCAGANLNLTCHNLVRTPQSSPSSEREPPHPLLSDLNDCIQPTRVYY